MADAQTARVKYLFMDIVDYTKGRSVDTQSEIIGYQSSIVLEALKAEQIKPLHRILIPTGDGMCIALIKALQPFDILVRLALAILNRIAMHNSSVADKEHQFEIRIGLNENEDNLVTDINRRRNVAGAGINMAQRVMSKGDAGHVLMGESVYTTLEGRKQYRGCLRGYDSRTKHGEGFRVYQYHNKEARGLNCKPPRALSKSSPALPKLRLFDLNKYGNLYWAALDLLWTVAYLRGEKTCDRILEGFHGANHHLNMIRLKKTPIKSRFENLYQKVKQIAAPDWTDERRVQVAKELESIARDFGDSIGKTQPGYQSHPKIK
jgi:hypothetical protein